ncbi:MAG: hypothetical protein HY917_02545 [Candidatus Diapherotrites archaeon]|nr:hypothetical protein [Candidatus Diapherotrites archaeon]
MGLKKTGKGPFRGPTPANVFQTVHVGSGSARRELSSAKGSPQRRYAAVDPQYASSPSLRVAGRMLAEAGMFVAGEKIIDFVARMKAGQLKARHLQFLMPFPNAGFYALGELFRELPSVLFPNGKVFFYSEDKDFLNAAGQLARSNGFSVKRVKELDFIELKRNSWGGLPLSDSMYTEALRRGLPIHLLEVTFGLKRAFPGEWKTKEGSGKKFLDKSKRKDWTRLG